jgi:hypothetical protein
MAKRSGSPSGRVSVPFSVKRFERVLDHQGQARLRPAVEMLRQARRYADDLKRGVWDFAVELDSLCAAGMTTSDVRWLTCHGYVEHALEISPAGDECRKFSPGGNLRFMKQSCFVLTKTGAKFADFVGGNGQPHNIASGPHWRTNGNGQSASPLPAWNAEHRELQVGELVVKRFRVPAPNQELILTSFQEEGWPDHIDDPLPPAADIDPKRRLHSAINSLNRNQKTPLIRFHGDGNGNGVYWELIS